MSASPLTAVQTVTPKIATPPTAQRDSASDSSFDSHLHDVQRQQQTSTNSNTSSSNNAERSRQTSASAEQSTSAQTDSAQSSNASTAAAAQTNASTGVSSNADTDETDADSSDASSVTTLASSVLNLIDQATGDADDVAGTAASSGKSASEKPGRASSNAQGPQQTASIAPLLLPIAPQTAAVKASAGNNAKADDGSVQAGGNATNGATATMSALNALGTATSQSASGDDDDGDGTDANSTSGASNSLVQAAADSTQALAATAMTAGHTLLSADTGSTASISSIPNTPDFASLRSALDATAVAAQPAAATAAHSLSNDAPVGSPGFAKELGQQVTWLSGQEVKQAQIRLNPENLGPLDVKVSVEHGRVDVAFTTQHPEATAAVQQGLNQLHHMLSNQGLSLGHATVGQQASQQQFAGQSQQGSSRSSAGADEATEEPATSTVQRVAVGLVDAFA